jgi:ATP-binding cassette subfamily B protein
MKIPLHDYMALLRRYLQPLRLRVALLALVLGGGILMQLISPHLLRLFIDGAVAGAGYQRLQRVAALFIAVSLVQQALAAYGKFVGEDVGLRATNQLRGDLVRWCLGLDMAFWRATRPGELIERADGDVELLANFFSQLVVGLAANLALLAGILAVLFAEDWRAGLGLSLFAVFALTAMFLVRNIAVPFWEAVRGYSARFYGFVGEHLSGTEDIQGLGAAGYVFRRMHELIRAWYPLVFKAELAGYALWGTSTGVFAVGNAVSFAIGYFLYRAGAISIGTVYMIFHYTQLLRRPIEQIRTQMQNLQRASAGIVRVQKLLANKPEITDGPGAGPGRVLGGPLAVRFCDVGFSYEQGAADATLARIDFTLRPGEALGLLGRTGSGKTTIARLLLRLYDPTSGRIELDGIPLPQLKLDELRTRIGMVTQDVEILSGTVRDNLTFFAPPEEVDDGRLWAVLEELGLAEWCRGLPRGLDTTIGQGGHGLSAGEAQLLGLARLFLRDPSVIVLDEASSRLDPGTERLLERALDRLLQGRGAVIIAHRLATIMRADSIMILDRGRVVEYGDRAALAADDASLFATLLRVGLGDHLA